MMKSYRFTISWPDRRGGKDSYSNLALVHLLCHQHIHAQTQRAMRDCQQFNDRELTEENANPKRRKQEENEEPCSS
jgi:RNA-directed DNA polymerase